MQTLTAEQFKQKYGESGVNSFANIPKTQERGYSVSELGQDITQMGSSIAESAKKRSENVGASFEAYKQGKQGLGSTALQFIGQSAGLGSDVIGEGFKGAVKAVLPQGAETGIKNTVEAGMGAVMNTDTVKNIVDKYNKLDPVTQRNINALIGIGSLTLDVATMGLGKAGVKGVAKAGEEGLSTVKTGATDLLKMGKGKIASTFENTPPAIMNRVARLKPTDFTKFEKTAGMTPGDYLVKTGNFGSPDKVIANEATKFVQSMNSVDETLAKLPGVYKEGSVADALKGLYKKAKSVSTESVPAPYRSQIESWVTKYNQAGLTMDEINQVKRLYEREVKLGYNKLLNADKVQQATNIDNAIRNWQVQKASDLGFTNIKALNKQTQISKFLVNKLGDQVVGQSGLNSMNLTDWIVLSGGNPTAVAGFLTKKFFSSKAVQAKIAEMLNKGGVQKLITPELKPTIENTLRGQWPQGRLPELPAPKEGALPSQNLVPIKSRPGFTQETQTPNGSMSSFNTKTGDQYIRDVKTGKVRIIPKRSSTQTPQPPLKTEVKISSPKSTTKPSSQSSLLQEAKKYKTAEEFVNSQTTVYHGSSNTNIQSIELRESKLSGGFGKNISFADNTEYARNFAGSKGKVYENYLDYKNPIILNRGESIYDKFPKAPRVNTADWLRKKGYDVIIAKGTPHGDEFAVLDTSIIKTKSQLTDIWKKAQGGTDNLLQEAKKYKSAEEFVKAQPTAYHFTSLDTKITKWTTNKSMGRVWFTDNSNVGENIGASGKGKMYTVRFDKNAKWATPEMADKYMTDQLIQQGYDGVYHPDSSKTYGNYYEVFNTKVIKTKSQLTDIWKKAHKK